ncbi:larval cuticle protein 2 [Drosophila virilis]|uniref:larval cuticle protein 2 n=1 Tax=Drosophila virilis TaxID=7244 RepID=UPI001395ECDD|nr:larval cuticle protein 2 [Drosophila virilis]
MGTSHKLDTIYMGQHPLKLYKSVCLVKVEHQSTFVLYVLQLHHIPIKMFKFVMICAVIGLAAAVHHPIEHRPVPHHPVKVSHPEPHPAPHPAPHPVPVHHGEEVHADVVSRKDDIRPDGFDSSLETTNHITRSESGDEHGNIHGSFGWISPEGEHIDIKYVADEHGYQPSGAAIPAIPEAIARSIAWNEAHPQAPEPHNPHSVPHSAPHGSHH